MTLSAIEVWTRILDRARHELPEQTFRTWLEPSEPLALEGNILTVGSPDQFAADWNESKHAEILTNLAPIVLGYPLSVVFRVHEERRTRNQMDLFVAPLPVYFPTDERHKQGGINTPLSDRYTFDHFVIGKSNELAAAATLAASQAPGKVYNPLFLYGDTGLGKTHLMQAVAHEVLSRIPQTRITFIGTEQLQMR